MKGFNPITLDRNELVRELTDFEALLNSASHLRERKHIAPFFKSHHQLVAALGLFHSGICKPDRVSSELHVISDFICDAASGDSVTNSYLLVEFEDANPNSVFNNADPGKARSWSPRFEHGASQLLDWAWRLDREGKTTVSFRQIFEKNHSNIHFLLIAGRNSDMSNDDLGRVLWRASNVTFGAYRMSFLTFDEALSGLRRKISFI